MDGVSAAASVVALVETSLKVVSLCVEYYSHVKNANHLAEQQRRHFSADIACYNGPRSFVIAGDDVSIQATEKASEAFPTSLRHKRLDNSHAFHSQLLDGIIPDLLQAAGELHFEAPVFPIEVCSKEDHGPRSQSKKLPDAFMGDRILRGQDNPVTWISDDTHCRQYLIPKPPKQLQANLPRKTSASGGFLSCNKFNAGNCNSTNCQDPHICSVCQHNHAAKECRSRPAASNSNSVPLGNRVMAP